VAAPTITPDGRALLRASCNGLHGPGAETWNLQLAAAFDGEALHDAHGRRISDLRVSVTDRAAMATPFG
jgi:hypothetical protein